MSGKIKFPHELTLRDWFAGQAMRGFASDPQYSPQTLEDMANHCYSWADAMLAARESQEKK